MFLIGKIVVATTAVKDNSNTAVPFTLPKFGKLVLEADIEGGSVALQLTAAVAMAAASGKLLPSILSTTDLLAKFEIPLPNFTSFLAVKNSAGGTLTVKVFWTK